ncbi:hypothetical protein EIP91_008095 [Steccherinum ochraceum]|uniref:Mitochondrial outer membrane transport complex Sam37/metaxin N-terminal domain-containing protein n=1 Tax=Steccherinum ochraceum TaxID=92696 RepID=A0A4R0R618_9APHY|nr:hypothetical protein EIP91_008095 [Steccherinum ochraceum]
MSLPVVGQLPCLTHGQKSISGFSAIVKFVDKLDEHSESGTSSLTAVERAQSVARIAQVEAELGDLVAHVYFALSANWYSHTRLALTSVLPVPQRYYVPARLRKAYQPRLEAAGLWSMHEEQAQEARFSAFEKLARRKEAQEKKEKLKRAVEREKTLSKAKAIVDPYAHALAGKLFFYGDGTKPSTLDIALSAHIYLLLQTLSDPTIANLLRDSYPQLASHAEAVYALALPNPESFPPLAPSPTFAQSLRSLFPPTALQHASSSSRLQRPGQKDEEASFARWRWALYGTMFVVTAAYVSVMGLTVPLSLAEAVAGEGAFAEGGEEEDEDYEEGEEED